MGLGPTPYGNSTTLDVTATQVIKAGSGTVYKITVVTAGSGGSLTLNDVLTVNAAASANAVITIPNASLTQGAIVTLEWPFQVGIVISAIPTGAQLSLSYA